MKGAVHPTTCSALKSFDPACDGPDEPLSQPCTTAVHRFCASTGATTGFGPLATDGVALEVTCLPTATIVHPSMTELYGSASRCEADPITCSVAAWNFCQSRGFLAGFGPVEAAPTAEAEDARDIVCLSP